MYMQWNLSTWTHENKDACVIHTHTHTRTHTRTHTHVHTHTHTHTHTHNLTWKIRKP